jgi:hypothetical protein
MKVRVITARRPWIDGAARDVGFEADVSSAEGAALVKNGFVEEVKPAPTPKAKAKKGDDE